MLDRKQLKYSARAHLRRAHWWVVLVVLLAFVMGGSIGSGLGGGLPAPNLETELEHSVDAVAPPEETWENPEELVAGLKLAFDTIVDGIKDAPLFFAMITVLALLSGMALVIFVCNLITVGVHRWLARYWLGETPSVASLFDPWRDYRRVMPAMALRSVYLFLWGLLIVPGVIKSYAYSMVPYLIGEYPELTPRQALALSQQMTYGHKWHLFVLDLSFFGWLLLSALTGGIVGILYVYPYIGVTHAGVYHKLKEQALHSGLLKPGT